MRILRGFLLTLVFVLPALAEEKPVPHHLVNLETAVPGLVLDIRYATTNNFTKEILYPYPRAYLHEDAARALAAVQKDLQAQGLGLKVFDGYRPLSAQQKMWDLIRDERYVSNPATNRGRHTRGTAIDVTLVDADGRELLMPTPYDDFTDQAHQDAPVSEPEKKNRALLRDIMRKHGFEIFPFEWWHFDLRDWKSYPVLDIDFEALERGETEALPVP